MFKKEFLVSGKKVNVIDKGSKIISEMPVGVFTLHFHPEIGAWFEQQPDIGIGNFTVYGNHGKLADTFYKGYMKRDINTGVLLSGLKGTGKTLISRIMSDKFITQGKPVVVIDRSIPPSIVKDMLSAIESEVLVIFDEFEKNYEVDDQNKLLSFLDGMYTSKRMVMVICNEIDKVSQYIIDRPNRMLYHKKFEGIERSEAIELLNGIVPEERKDIVEDVLNYVRLTKSCSYDIIKNMVSTCVDLGISVEEAKDILNIPTGAGSYYKHGIRILGNPAKLAEYVKNSVIYKTSSDRDKDYFLSNVLYTRNLEHLESKLYLGGDSLISENVDEDELIYIDYSFRGNLRNYQGFSTAIEVFGMHKDLNLGIRKQIEEDKVNVYEFDGFKVQFGWLKDMEEVKEEDTVSKPCIPAVFESSGTV